MNYNFVTNLGTCIPSALSMLNGSFNLLYYSHIPIAVLSIFFGILVLIKGKFNLISKIFFLITVLFTLWVGLDLFTWLSSDTRVIMFSWSIIGLVDTLFFVLSVYFVYLFVAKQDAILIYKLFFGLLMLPLLIMVPTSVNLLGFNVAECYSLEHNYALNYRYFVEVFLLLVMVFFSISTYIKSDKYFRKQILLLSSSVTFFLLSFFSSVFLSGYLVDSGVIQGYGFEIYGLFGMTVFLGFLAFLIVRFKIFNIKLLGAQALVVATVILIGSQFAFVRNFTNKVLTAITLALVIIFGSFLIRSVKKENQQKENLEKLSIELQSVNLRLQEVDRQKTEFLSIASHQLRTPMSIMKGYIELIQDGAFGKIGHKLKGILNEMDESNERLVKLIDEFLDITRIEQGRTRFSYADHDFNEMVSSVVKELQGRVGGKHLRLVFVPNKQIKNVYMDDDKVRHVIFNFIDNAVKYSEKGTIHAVVEKDRGKVVVRIKDNGLGFGPEDGVNFFQKFYRGNNVKGTNVTGTGLGLFVCRKFIETHGGKVWAHSAGIGKGSEFGFFIPIKAGNGGE